MVSTNDARFRCLKVLVAMLREVFCMSDIFKYRWASRVATYLFVFLFGSTVVHAVVMAIDWLTSFYSREQHNGHLHGDFVSLEMLPMMLAYGTLSLCLFIVWKRMKTLENDAHRRDLLLTEQKSTIETAQKLTGIIVEKVAGENAVLGDWVYQNKKRGKTVSPRLESATENIGKALQALSKVTFEAPYVSENHAMQIDEMERLLHELIEEDCSLVEKEEAC